MTAGLQATGMSVRFGGLRALSDASITVARGELTGLIGPNGAGKTTFIDAITGFLSCAGSVQLGGRDLDGLAPHQRARAGLARTWQGGELFEDLTVRDNVAVASVRPSLRQSCAEILGGRRRRSEAVDDALALLELGDLAEELPANLSEGHRKLIGVARAVATAPHALCLDEPAAGLDTRESTELGQRLRTVAERGIATLLVDHDMGLVMSICDRIVVLDLGEVIAAGTPDEVRANPRVVAAYLGERGARADPAIARFSQAEGR